MKALRVERIPPYVQGELAQAVLEERIAGRDIIDLSQANPHTEPPADAVESLVQSSLLPHNHRYSASRGISKLREAIADWYEKRHDVSLDPDQEVVATMGTKDGLAHLLLAMVESGDSVIVPTPAYPIHRAAVSIAGGSVVSVPLPAPSAEPLSASGAEIFFQQLEASVEATWPQPKAMVVSFPHNPTTTVVTLDFLERLVSWAREKECFIIHDFAYAEMCFDGYKAPSILQVEGAREVAVELYSLSKAFSIPGWRVGFCVGNRQLVQALTRIKSYLDFGIFQPLQIGALKVFSEGVVDEQRSLYRLRRDIVVPALQKVGFELETPKATMLLWARVPKAFHAQGSLSFCKALLKGSGVALCPGVGFDEQASEFVRFALVEPERRLQSALRAISAFVEGTGS